jgi:gluconolactonase
MPPLEFDVRDSRLLDVIAPDAELEIALSGFQFTEGPVWHPTDHHLMFSDIQGNTIYRWAPGGDLQVFRVNSHLANGNTYDRQGRLLTCHHGTSRVTRTESDGSVTILAAHYNGQQLNSPNDIVVSRDGAIYFTDPPYGRSESHGIPREQELDFYGVYRLDPVSGDLTLLVDDFERPNGLCFSLDETQLYIDDSARHHIRVFDVQADGTLANGRIWAETSREGHGVPDGMKIDSAGMLFACAAGGVHVFTSDAVCLGVIHIPEHAANFCWGDADLRTLYITASTSVYRLRMQQAGVPLF